MSSIWKYFENVLKFKCTATILFSKSLIKHLPKLKKITAHRTHTHFLIEHYS